MSNGKTVLDGKLTDEQLGKLQRKFNEVIKRINEQALDYEETSKVLQLIVVEGRTSDFLKVIRGTHEVLPIKNAIDLEAAPYVPPCYILHDHIGCGPAVWIWDPKKLILWDYQENHNYFYAQDTIGRIFSTLDKDTFQANANVLDFLLAHQELIPENWPVKGIFFPGTTYKAGSGSDDLCVRMLYKCRPKWESALVSIENYFEFGDQIAQIRWN